MKQSPKSAHGLTLQSGNRFHINNVTEHTLLKRCHVALLLGAACQSVDDENNMRKGTNGME